MTTDVDANVVLDMLTGSSKEIESAYSAMRAAKLAGDLTISSVAYAEVAVRFRSKTKTDDFFSLLNCEIQPLDEAAAFLAGQFYRQYKQRGVTRTRILTDFLIAAHAQSKADRILNRDSRFFGASFPQLKAVRPEDLV